MSLVVLSCSKDGPKFPGHGGDGSGGNSSGSETLSLNLEINFLHDWQSTSHIVNFPTKANGDNYRVVIEIKQGNTVKTREFRYISANEYLEGVMYHTPGIALGTGKYEVAVWCDKVSDSGDYLYDFNDLNGVSIQKTPTEDWSVYECNYGYSVIDLTSLSSETSKKISHKVEMMHAGSRFEFVATDVNKFILNNKEALNKGERFTVKFTPTSGAFKTFNLYQNAAYSESSDFEYSGWMCLPFDEYDELKIAEGFLFTEEETIVKGFLSIYNSNSEIVTRTKTFSFPAKRGSVTVIRGEFLTQPLDGNFSVDNNWEGEIHYDI